MSRKNIEKSFSEYTDADFELESVNFYESFLASEESQAVEETQKEKVATKKDKRVVIDKAEYQFGPHKATFKPLTKTPSIQGKKVGTIVETQPVNFSFEDGFQLTTLGQWEKYGTAKFQSNKVILQGSEISYVGQMPGSNSVETGKAKCTQSGQKKDYEGIDTTDAAFPNYTSKAKVVQGYWAADEYGTRRLKEAELEQTVYFIIETVGINDGEQLQVQLWDYDYQIIPVITPPILGVVTFLMRDYLNPDDPMDNGYKRTCVVKNNKAILKVYLKPEWNKEIEEEKRPFSIVSIELYCKVFYNNKSYDFPNSKKDYLRVRRGRNVFIKPIISKEGNHIAEMYGYDGSPLFFMNIDAIEPLDDTPNKLKETAKDLMITGAVASFIDSSPKLSDKVALVKLDKGYLVTSGGNTVKGGKIKPYNEFIGEKWVTYFRAQNRGTFVAGETTKGLSQLKAMKNKLMIPKTMYFVRNGVKMFDTFSSLVDLSAGGKDVNSFAKDVIALAQNTSLCVGLFYSVLAKLTLDVVFSPMEEFMEEEREVDKKKLDGFKYEGLRTFKAVYNDFRFLTKDYKFMEISYDTMDGLLNGKIKKRKDLKTAFNEVTIFYKEMGDDMLIDCFFVSAER